MNAFVLAVVSSQAIREVICQPFVPRLFMVGFALVGVLLVVSKFWRGDGQ